MTLFKKAVKHEAKLRLAIAGPSGSGKTYTALKVAATLANGGSVALVDTEHGSASKYADLFDFDVAMMSPPYHPDKYLTAIDEAASADYDVLILDSMSHTWNGAGGMLEMVDKFARTKYKGNSYAAWNEVTPMYQRLVDAIIGADLHIIATMRSKQDYILVERNGKQVPQKVGMAPIQRDGFEYEFDVFLDMDIENNAVVSKSRCPALAGEVIEKPGAGLAETLRDWLLGEERPAQADDTPMTGSDDEQGREEYIGLDTARKKARKRKSNLIPATCEATGWHADDVKEAARQLGFESVGKTADQREKQFNTLMEFAELAEDGIEGGLILAVINGVLTREEAEKQMADIREAAGAAADEEE